MKQSIRSLSLVMVFCLLAALVPMLTGGGTTACAAGDFTIENGVLTKYNGSGGDVTIPSGVTAIGDTAFWFCDTLTAVTIPDTVTTVGTGAFFGCTGLTELTLGKSVRTIGASAFCGTGLTSLTLPASVRSLGDDAFEGCKSLSSLTLPYGLEEIGGGAFAGCEALVGFRLPTSVRTMGRGVFRDCTGLQNVILSTGLTAIPQEAFMGCTNMISIEIPGGVTEIGTSAFSGCESLRYVTLPDSLTKIGGAAFENCPFLMSVTVPDAVTAIGSFAFYGCESLRSMAIPAAVTSIGEQAFARCTSMTSLTVDSGNQHFTVRDNVLYDARMTLLKVCAGGRTSGLTMPNAVTAIEPRAFAGCAGLTDVKMSSALETVGLEAFAGCTGLTELAFPDTVSSIGSGAFRDCANLEKITLPCDLTVLSSNLFNGCARLTDVTVPSGVTVMPFAAFEGCAALTEMRLPDTVEIIASRVFADCESLTRVTVPVSVETFESDVFTLCPSLTDLYYAGTRQQWAQINRGYGVTLPAGVTVHYNTGSLFITRQPADASGTVGEKVTFSVEAEGDNLSYQWYYKKANESSFTAWNGKTSASVSTQVYASWHNAQFYCMISDNQGNALTSDTAKLTVLPAITQQPKDVSGAVGDTATFTVKATGVGLTYQWYYNKSGGNDVTAWSRNASASTPIYASWNGTTFYCVVTDENGNTLYSDPVMLTVLPKITQQPKDASGKVNDTATFTVKATGTGLCYQWYMKKANDSAFTAWNKKTTASVSTPIYQSWNGAQFYCVVTDANDRTVKSNTVKLTVSAAAAEGPEIHSQPMDASGKVGNTVSFVVQTWDREATFQWYYRKKGESGFTLWKGQTKPTAVTTVYASWNQAEFYCILTGANGGTRKTDTVKLIVVPVFTEQPKNVSGTVNANAAFSVKATGAGLTYQWYYKKAGQENATKWNGKTSASVSTPIYASWNNAQIYCVITDANGRTVKSNAAMLTVLPAITTQPQNASGAVGDTAAFSVKATGAGLTYQWYVRKSGESSFTAWNKKTSAGVSTPIYKSWDGAQFYCVVKDVSGKTVQSNTVTLTVK